MIQRYMRVAKASTVWPDNLEWQFTVAQSNMDNNFVVAEVDDDIWIEEIPSNELYQTPMEMFFDVIDDGVNFTFERSASPVFTRRTDGTRWVYAESVG